jgi:hypothetical protein
VLLCHSTNQWNAKARLELHFDSSVQQFAIEVKSKVSKQFALESVVQLIIRQFVDSVELSTTIGSKHE